MEKICFEDLLWAERPLNVPNGEKALYRFLNRETTNRGFSTEKTLIKDLLWTEDPLKVFKREIEMRPQSLFGRPY